MVLNFGLYINRFVRRNLLHETALIKFNTRASKGISDTGTLEHKLLIYFNNIYIRNTEVFLHKLPFQCKE